MEVQIKEDEGGVATRKKSCVNKTKTTDVGLTFGKDNEAGDRNGGLDPKYFHMDPVRAKE